MRGACLPGDLSRTELLSCAMVSPLFYERPLTMLISQAKTVCHARTYSDLSERWKLASVADLLKEREYGPRGRDEE